MAGTQCKIYAFIQAPDPERVNSYLLEGGFPSGQVIDKGMLMIETDGSDDGMGRLMDTLNSDMFLQRRVNRVYICDSTADDEGIAISMLEGRMAKGVKLRVQSYPKSIEGGVVDLLESHGFALRPQDFEQIAYLVNLEGRYFIGLYGMDRCFIRNGEKERQPSRAYYKIAEAVARFGIRLDGDGRALDIGAAPGGWSKYLSGIVKLCVSVDPANMDISSENIKHIKKTFQDGIEEIESYAPYDIIVCDANIDPRQVAAFVSERRSLLSENGILVMTLKFKHKSGESAQRTIEDTSNILSKSFNSISVKKLLSNTLREATLCARKA